MATVVAVVDTRIITKEDSNSNTDITTGVTEVATKDTKEEVAISSNHTTNVVDTMKADSILEVATKGSVAIALATIAAALAIEAEEVAKVLCVEEEEIAWEASSHSIDLIQMVASSTKWAVEEDKTSSTL